MNKSKKSDLKKRLIWLYMGSFIVSLAPVLMCLVFNWNKYVKAPSDVMKLTIAGIVLVIILFLKVIGKLKMPRRVVTFGIVFILSYLLKSVLEDLILLSGMALLGEFIDCAIFQWAIKKTKEEIIVDKTADKTAEQVEEVIKKYIGRV